MKQLAYVVAASVLVGGSLAAWQHSRDDALIASQITACQRGNALRAEMNARQEIQRTYMLTAADARAHAARIEQNRPAEARINRRAANLWRRLAKQMKHFTLVNCDDAVRR